MAGMVPAGTGIVIVPALVVDRDPHFWRIAVIHILTTLVVFLTPVISWVVDVWVMVETLPVLITVGVPPVATVCPFIGITSCRHHAARKQHGTYHDQETATNHGNFPPVKCAFAPVVSCFTAWRMACTKIDYPKEESAIGILGIEGISDKTGKVHHRNGDVVVHVLFAMIGR